MHIENLFYYVSKNKNKCCFGAGSMASTFRMRRAMSTRQ